VSISRETQRSIITTLFIKWHVNRAFILAPLPFVLFFSAEEQSTIREQAVQLA
jgi:hypothetical protein